jgi:hypothetical protein
MKSSVADMRLLNTHTLEFREFFSIGRFDPRYAFLSHRWGDDEVSYEDYITGKKRYSVGFRKIVDFCNLARSRGLDWAWVRIVMPSGAGHHANVTEQVDTCCIDKRSSAELTEAINSMFKWYWLSTECYAYLVNVTAPLSDFESVLAQFQASIWFSRGWTLQELLAPVKLLFFTADWQCFGCWQLSEDMSRDPKWNFHDPRDLQERFPLLDRISSMTGIGEEKLKNTYLVFSTSFAQVMSWMAKRHTSRSEDMAYYLLGLLDVKMPLLYGEGSKALIRLQSPAMRAFHSSTPDIGIYEFL